MTPGSSGALREKVQVRHSEKFKRVQFRKRAGISTSLTKRNAGSSGANRATIQARIKGQFNCIPDKYRYIPRAVHTLFF